MGEVLRLTELGNDVVQVTMEDREARNVFSIELIEALIKVFKQIDEHPTYKVVVLTGYDNYFCCGGSQRELFRICKGEITFNDLNFASLPLDCKLPVVAAMQGHGIGGGFVFGLYADFPILGKENIYTTNFMKYGFTPGMGATMIVPLKLGEAIGNEMLFSARNFRGAELKERGIPLRVVPKADVLKEAIELAFCLAEKTRLSLMMLKAHKNETINSILPGIIEKELAMHQITFRQPEVPMLIESLFGK
ncbi:polyketide biosynthesis enoyl-CoA hydratase PksI [Chitinophaga sp. CF118]|uniref:polyketide synthase n=1 Tax=Chitinophaga sp. CF118 TaxID=1884367 RepID=UPI0008E353EA|nr:polyketide synthase [Chitinophaga sp. CF118]SFD21573.1 polyketide biosynthesis enoyl-CoA hydratase PksI [Chitinophaga sp. CF118]